MQQVHSIKDAATQMPQPDVDVNIDFLNLQFTRSSLSLLSWILV